MLEEATQRLRLPSVRARILAETLRDAGIAHVDPIMAGGDAITFEGGVEFMSARHEVAFQREFVKLTRNRPDLWVRCGLEQSVMCYGVHGMAAMSSPTLRDFAQMIAQTHMISISFIRYSSHIVDGRMMGLNMDTSGVPEDLLAFSTFAEIASLSKILREMYGGPVPGLAVEMAASAPLDRSFLDALDIPIRFDADLTRAIWRSGVGEEPLPHGNAFLHRLHVDHCRRLIELVQDDDFATKLTELLQQRPLDLGQAAELLHISERTLQRRLRELGAGFRALSDQVRSQRARKLLSDSKLDIADISLKMGYSEVASFHHAFKRWTGQGPARYRNLVARNCDLAGSNAAA